MVPAVPGKADTAGSRILIYQEVSDSKIDALFLR
jgi:hypothetical protein